jgi:hypothetical protein
VARDGERSKSWPSRLLAAALVVAFVMGFLAVSSVVLVRGRLLDPGLYDETLVRTDAYERVYTEVLADPELAEATERLLGGYGLDAPGATQVRTLATSSLRLAVPPDLLRRGTEAFVAAVLAYLRGDTDRLDADVDVTEVVARVRLSAETWVGGVLATADERVASTREGYRAAVDAFADRLEAGRLPGTIPVLGGTAADRQAAVDLILARLGADVDPQVREQIRAAALSGDERDALIAAASQLVAGQVSEAVGDLRASLEDRHELDAITELADRAGQSRNAVVGQLNTARDAARWLGPPMAAAGAVLMVGAAAGIVWLERRDPRRAGYLLAASALAAGLTIVAAWALAAWLVEPPLEPATETGADTWRLPPGLRALLADIVASLADDLAGTARRLALVPLAAGAALAAGIAVAPRLRLPSPRRAVGAGAAAAVVAGLVAWAGPALAAGGEVRACNGHPELCDRPYDEVVYAATHNSMASPDVVRIWPEQDGDIRAQLDAGVRALLIDTHHWTPLVSDEQLMAADTRVPPAVAEQVFARLGRLRQGRDGAFLCHNQCALGAIPLVDALGAIREFLDENPDEVVTLIVQDEISPAETARAFGDAGLDRHVHEHEPGSPWATLGELIDRDERLVVFAENEGPPPAWYLQAFEQMQDTPYGFARPEDFACGRNRGDSDASLFLMNHWVSRPNSAPDRATALQVNAHDVLVGRARTCERERGQMVNYVAVDFSNLGDVMGAVDTLNRVG